MITAVWASAAVKKISIAFSRTVIKTVSTVIIICALHPLGFFYSCVNVDDLCCAPIATGIKPFSIMFGFGHVAA
jgi:hypothetical protein